MKNRTKVVISVICSALFFAACGDTGMPGATGPQGPQGEAGAKGDPGKNGSSVSVDVVPFISSDLCASGSGVLIKILSNDLVTSQAAVCNGANGQNAPEAPYNLTGVIDPCGDAPGISDEVLLKTADGHILASFSDNANGKNTRLSILTPGTYVTTDGSSCVFVVHADGSIS
jgi:hypothetical protein